MFTEVNNSVLFVVGDKEFFCDAFNVVKGVTKLSAVHLNANVREFKERQASLRASADADARRCGKLRRMPIARKQGRGLPKRGDVSLFGILSIFAESK